MRIGSRRALAFHGSRLLGCFPSQLFLLSHPGCFSCLIPVVSPVSSRVQGCATRGGGGNAAWPLTDRTADINKRGVIAIPNCLDEETVANDGWVRVYKAMEVPAGSGFRDPKLVLGPARTPFPASLIKSSTYKKLKNKKNNHHGFHHRPPSCPGERKFCRRGRRRQERSERPDGELEPLCWRFGS